MLHVELKLDRDELCILFQALELRKCVQVASGGFKTMESRSLIEETARLSKKVTQEIRCLDKYGSTYAVNGDDEPEEETT